MHKKTPIRTCFCIGQDTINRQAVLCHRVLRTLQHIAQESKILERETWEALLLFLLAINDTLLSPPTIKDDVADQLCERVLSVLFEVSTFTKAGTCVCERVCVGLVDSLCEMLPVAALVEDVAGELHELAPSHGPDRAVEPN